MGDVCFKAWILISSDQVQQSESVGYLRSILSDVRFQSDEALVALAVSICIIPDNQTAEENLSKISEDQSVCSVCSQSTRLLQYMSDDSPIACFYRHCIRCILCSLTEKYTC